MAFPVNFSIVDSFPLQRKAKVSASFLAWRAVSSA
jgi:hypothetical protein